MASALLTWCLPVSVFFGWSLWRIGQYAFCVVSRWVMLHVWPHWVTPASLALDKVSRDSLCFSATVYVRA